jgi:hypothetical protein
MQVRTGISTQSYGNFGLAELFECGLLRGSYIPAPGLKEVRDLTRYRIKTVQARTSEIQRLGKALESAQLTELRGRIAVSGGSACGRAARFPAHDQRRGWAAGSVVAEGAALRGG